MPHTSSKPAITLIATLGTEAQVITATIDLLQVQGITPDRVLVIHTCSHNPAIQQAVQRLQDALQQAPYEKIDTRLVPVMDPRGRPLEDIETPEAARSAFKTLYQLIRTAKMAGDAVYVAIAGGRKTLALYGMVAAQLLFDESDQLLYLFSSGDFLSSKRLHPAEGDQVSLVPIPVILWNQVTPLATEIREIEDPFDAIEQVKRLQLNAKCDNARSFVYGALTAAERRVVEVLVRDGLSDVEIGERLFISPRTVEQHLRSAYSKAAAHWEVENVNRAQLVSLLQYFFITKLRENPQDTMNRKA